MSVKNSCCFLLFLALVALVSGDSPTVNPKTNYLLVGCSQPITKFLPGPYTRVWVPAASDITKKQGQLKVGDIVIVTFVRNENRGTLDFGQTNEFPPLECRYGVAVKNQAYFSGCYNSASETSTLRTSEESDPVFVENSEVYSATRIIIQTIRYPASRVIVDDDVNLVDIDDDHEGYCNTDYAPTVYVVVRKYTPNYNELMSVVYDMRRATPTNDSLFITPQVRNLNIYFKSFVLDSLLHDHLDDFRPLLNPDATYEVIGLSNYSGATNVFSYQKLSSFTATENLAVLDANLLRFWQTGHTVVAEIMFDTLFTQQPNPALQHWYNKYMVMVEFDKYANIFHFTHSVNVLGAIVRGTPASQLNITTMCQKIQTVCTSDIKMDEWPDNDVHNINGAQQYASVGDCIAYVSSIPLLGPNVNIQVTGKNAQCIRWHLNIAATGIEGARHHCLHTGPLNIPGVTPCQDG